MADQMKQLIKYYKINMDYIDKTFRSHLKFTDIPFIKKIVGMPANLWFRRGFDKPYTYIQSIDFELVGKCNLNCKGCNHFSPISENEELDVCIFNKDLKQLYNVLGDRIGCISLLGGEPLLHNEIEHIMKIARSNFPNTRIMILTNGILLKNISDSFWDTAKQNRIEIEVTRYPIDFDYDAVIKIGRQHGVNIKYFGRSGYVQKTLFTLPLNLKGGCNRRNSFMKCYMARRCITFRNGKLYPCSYAAYMYRFNSYFNKNIPITESDCADIYKMSKEDILNLIGNPIPLCEYCDVNRRIYGNKWERSKKTIDEWT